MPGGGKRSGTVKRRMALLVLSTPQWPVVRLHLDRIAAAVDAATTGSVAEVAIPYR